MPSPEETKRFSEQRAHPRVPTAIAAKISVPADLEIRECLVTDLSAGGAGLQYTGPAPSAEMVCLLTISGFGSFEGITTRDNSAVCGVRFLFGEAERRHLQENLIAFIKDGMAAVSVRRRERGREKAQLSFIRTNGECHCCDVRDISLQGAGLQTTVRPPLGELVKLSRMYGRVVRHDEDGIGIQFVSIVTGPDPAAPPAISVTA